MNGLLFFYKRMRIPIPRRCFFSHVKFTKCVSKCFLCTICGLTWNFKKPSSNFISSLANRWLKLSQQIKATSLFLCAIYFFHRKSAKPGYQLPRRPVPLLEQQIRSTTCWQRSAPIYSICWMVGSVFLLSKTHINKVNYIHTKFDK